MLTPDRDTGLPVGEFAFVGRQRELGLLLATLRHPPAIALVEGEAGIGKSRLVREAAGVLAAEHHRVVTGFCHPLREPLRYGPVMDALRKAGDWLPATGVPPTAGALSPLLPDLAERLPPPPPRVEGAQAERHQLLQGVRSFLHAIGPTVLVIEDLHWVDEDTRDLLLLLARDLPEQLCLVLTYRSEDLPPDRPVLGSAYRRPPGTNGTVIRLAPLSEQDVQELAGHALGASASPGLAAALYRRSEGLPLVAEEDLLTLAGQERDGNRGTAEVLERAQVPPGLREAVTERLAALSPAGTAVVEAAAVLARPAAGPLLTDLAGLSAEQADQGLIDALQRSVLQETGPDQYGFRHVLAQQVVYERLQAPRRLRLHQQAVAVLRAQSPPPLVQIAHHTLAAGDRAAWFRCAEEAADEAIRMGDAGTAGTLLRQILAQPHLDGDLRSRTALELARITINGADYVADAAALRRIIADPQLATATRGEIRLSLGLLMINQAGDRAGFGELETCVAELATRPAKAARALTALAINGRDRDRAWSWLDQADQVLSTGPDEAAAAAVRATRLTLMARDGDPAVWPLLDELPRQSDDPEVLRQTARALCNAGSLALDLGHDRRAADLLAESLDLAVRIDVGWLELYSRLLLIQLDARAGNWAGLEESYASLQARYPESLSIGTEQALTLGRLALAGGRRTLAIEQFSLAAEHSVREPQESESLSAAAGLATVRLAQGSPHDAWAIAAPAVALLRSSSGWACATGLVPAAVEAALAHGDRPAAEQLVADAATGLRGKDAPAALAELQLARGLLHQDAEPEYAAQDFALAQRGWQEIGRPYETAQAAERLGLTLARVRTEDAAAPLTQALDTYTRLGAVADAARCKQAMTEAGLAKPSAAGRPGYGSRLSPREQQVADLLKRGATNQEIADALFLSPRTVEQHVAKVLKKLGTTRRAILRLP
jgi:DNA-binding CsgD family transcriptional regulator